MTLLVVVGLAHEARIVRNGLGGLQSEVRTMMGGGRSAALAEAIATAVSKGSVDAILSFGLAGALAPHLEVGDVLAPSQVRTVSGERFATDADWAARLRASCGAGDGDLLGADAAVAEPRVKRDLSETCGAVAVDMESHVAARVAAAHGLRLAVLRVVSDRADHALPSAALAGMRADGGVDVGAVLRSLARAPGQLPALIRTGREAGRAFSALAVARRAVGPRFEAPVSSPARGEGRETLANPCGRVCSRA